EKGSGHMPIAALEPKHMAKCGDTRGLGGPASGRNEMPCLSSARSWAVEAGVVPTNVAKGVRRPRKSVRERLVTEAEYRAVHAVAGASVRLAMVLCVRTLGLPADVLRMGRRNLVRYDDGRQT